jgi:hypothetical protein
MKSDKDVQLNRGRCVYSSTQRLRVIDVEEEIIEDNTAVDSDAENTVVPVEKKQEDIVTLE